MSVNYRKVVSDLTDVIKELNVPCGAAPSAAAAAPASRRGSAETRRADAVDFLKALVGELEQGTPPEGADAAGAVAEHGSASAGNKNIANILFGKETPVAEATSATKVQVTLKGEVVWPNKKLTYNYYLPTWTCPLSTTIAELDAYIRTFFTNPRLLGCYRLASVGTKQLALDRFAEPGQTLLDICTGRAPLLASDNLAISINFKVWQD